MTTPEKYNKYKEISRVNVNKIVTLGMAFRDIGMVFVIYNLYVNNLFIYPAN